MLHNVRTLQELRKRRLTEQREERQRTLESEIQSKDEYWIKENSRQLELKVSLEYSTIDIDPFSLRNHILGVSHDHYIASNWPIIIESM